MKHKNVLMSKIFEYQRNILVLNYGKNFIDEFFTESRLPEKNFSEFNLIHDSLHFYNFKKPTKNQGIVIKIYEWICFFIFIIIIILPIYLFSEYSYFMKYYEIETFDLEVILTIKTVSQKTYNYTLFESKNLDVYENLCKNFLKIIKKFLFLNN